MSLLRRLLNPATSPPAPTQPPPVPRGPRPTVTTSTAITPSYNQGIYLPDCLNSVASQTHPAVEHLVLDPGSTDDSREIAANFGAAVQLIAEPDDGQADAVNKGMRQARGDVIAWINADDVYHDDEVFAAVIARFNQPDQPDLVYGGGIYVGADLKKIKNAYINNSPETLPQRLQHELGILQPATFFRRDVLESVGYLDDTLRYALDYDFWIRCKKANMRFVYLDRPLAKARYYPQNKTLGERGKSLREVCKVVDQHFGYVHEKWCRRLAEWETERLDGVLTGSGNTRPKNIERVNTKTHNLLLTLNGGYHSLTHLQQRATEPPVATTAKALRQARGDLEPICRPVSLQAKGGRGLACYTVGEQRWAFDAKWVHEQRQRTRERFDHYAATRRGDTCVIVGNGPSLNNTDLTLLDGTDTFCSNYAFLKPELRDRATYLSVVNHLVAEQGAQEFNLLTGVRKLFPFWLGYCIVPAPVNEDTHFFRSVGLPEFSAEIHENVSWRHTVSFFQLQIAYGLGYRKAVMIGFDHSYRQQPEVSEGEVIEQHDADSNHFDASYFRGKKWHAADVDNMEAMYKLAKAAWEADGREIINATEGGNLELFKRAKLFEAIERNGEGS